MPRVNINCQNLCGVYFWHMNLAIFVNMIFSRKVLKFRVELRTAMADSDLGMRWILSRRSGSMLKIHHNIHSCSHEVMVDRGLIESCPGLSVFLGISGVLFLNLITQFSLFIKHEPYVSSAESWIFYIYREFSTMQFYYYAVYSLHDF